MLHRRNFDTHAILNRNNFWIHIVFFRMLLIMHEKHIFSYKISLASNLLDNQNLEKLEKWVCWTQFPPQISLPVIAALWIIQMLVETIAIFIFLPLSLNSKGWYVSLSLRSCSGLLQACSFVTCLRHQNMIDGVRSC